MSFSIKGLYLVTPDCDDTDWLCSRVAQALEGGVALVQYRHKTASPALRQAQAAALLALCRQAGRPLIINDDVVLAAALDAHGVHVGQHDSEVATARGILGPDKIIGASCYGHFTLAEQAQAAGASYVAFGACYPSATKPAAPRAMHALFTQARQQLAVPVVGIGGITLDNAEPLVRAGADALAVISDLFQADDIRMRCQQYQALFSAH